MINIRIAFQLMLTLALEGTEAGKTHGAKGLARICITMNPEIAFHGQRCYEVVRPLLHLLHVEQEGIDNYEALLALTNLASVSDSVRLGIDSSFRRYSDIGNSAETKPAGLI